jgi:hypothetical protein
MIRISRGGGYGIVCSSPGISKCGAVSSRPCHHEPRYLHIIVFDEHDVNVLSQCFDISVDTKNDLFPLIVPSMRLA